jgi:hypothetical protein
MASPRNPRDPDRSDVIPIFLLSLPRSGSTLVQRVVASHSLVATTSEPWLLLPLVYARRAEGVVTEYDHRLSVVGLNDFVAGIPNGDSRYQEAIRTFALSLYREAARNGETYFLDKTPRYHFIATDLMKLFPEAKFIVLWRNPLAVVASIGETWGKGAWIGGSHWEDLHVGLTPLLRIAQQRDERVMAMRFEDFLARPEAHWKRICQFLSIPYEPGAPERFHTVQLRGKLGDQTGASRYRRLDLEPLDRWKRSFASPVRRAWARHYLAWIGENRLSIMGYDPSELLRELRPTPAGMWAAISDAWDLIASGTKRKARRRLWTRLETGRWRDGTN